MDPNPDAVTTDDWALVTAARAGDRLAFGLLYLRHHAAAWRLACISSRFSPDAELAVIEGFTRIFSALPAETEPLAAGGVSFRPYVLACVRQSALDRARAAGREETGEEPPGALAGLGPDGEVVLSTLEHHVAHTALAALPERSRTALWLTDVEGLTPAEVGGILLGPPPELAALAAGARAQIHAAQESALDRQEVRAGCRYTVDRLDSYQAGALDPAEGLDVRSHLEHCPPCRMRQGELGNAPAALAAAVPSAPLLGGEAQHHWLASAADLSPAARLLPPGLAAGGAAPRQPRARLTATRLGTAAGAAMAPARRLPGAVRRAGRAAAGHWRSGPGAIDLTTRSDLLGSPDRPAATDPSRRPGRTGAAEPTGAPDPGSSDPTVPPGWTGSPGWSGSPLPSLPPAWTTPPGRATGRRPDGRRAGRRRDRQVGRRLRAAGPSLALAGGLSARARRAGRSVRPALPATALVVAWFVVMAAVPWLMTPGTAPGPRGLALPAVQAYLPGYSPGGAPSGTSGSPQGGAMAAALSGGKGASTASGFFGADAAAAAAAAIADAAGPETAFPAIALGGQPVTLVAAASGPARSGGHHSNSRPAPQVPGPIPAPVGPPQTAVLAPPPAAVIPAVIPAAPVTAIPPPTDTAIPTPTGATTTSSLPTPTGSGKSGTKQKHKKRDATSQDGPNPSARGRQAGAGMQAVPRVRIVEA